MSHNKKPNQNQQLGNAKCVVFRRLNKCHRKERDLIYFRLSILQARFGYTTNGDPLNSALLI